MSTNTPPPRRHYQFERYMTKARWISFWHQLDEINKLHPDRVLEIGPGPGLFKSIAGSLGIVVETLDLSPDLQPDFVASATTLPFADSSYDVVCAFQMLEHIPYEESLRAFAEMARVARKQVVISLPDAQILWRYRFHLPVFGAVNFSLPSPRLQLPVLQQNDEHYWEVNVRGYPLSRISEDFSKLMPLTKTYRVPENPYHRFFVFAHTRG